MKLLIASDIHGSAPYAKVLQQLFDTHKPDKLLLLGDLLYHGPRNDLPNGYAPKEVIPILNSLKHAIIAVRGNCEAEVDQMVLDFPVMADYAQIMVDNHTLFVTHGHLYGEDTPPPMGAWDVLLNGHTHIGAEKQKNNFVYINPGSLALPKDGNHSYTLYENNVFTRYNVQGNILGRYSL